MCLSPPPSPILFPITRLHHFIPASSTPIPCTYHTSPPHTHVRTHLHTRQTARHPQTQATMHIPASSLPAAILPLTFPFLSSRHAGHLMSDSPASCSIWIGKRSWYHCFGMGKRRGGPRSGDGGGGGAAESSLESKSRMRDYSDLVHMYSSIFV